jgi:hypothetical protein
MALAAGITWISAGVCYQLRCSLIHSGTAEMDKGKISVDEIVFFNNSAGGHLAHFGGNVVDGVAQPTVTTLNAERFSNTL